MNEIWLGAAFFAFVLTAVLAAGYVILRSTEQRRAESSPALSPHAGLPASRAHSRTCFKASANTPAAKNEKNPYRVKLAAAGYSWPSALPIFYASSAASRCSSPACSKSWYCSTQAT